MLDKKVLNSQLTNFKTYELFKRDCLSLAENVFLFKNMPDSIDISFLNSILLRKGSIAFFWDEILGLLALPYVVIDGCYDVYKRPTKIEVYSNTINYRRVLKKDEFVIMYDNTTKYPIYLDICQFAERLSLIRRTIDINVSQQKTPRVWKTTTEKEKSVRDLLNYVDSNVNAVTTFDDIAIDDLSCVLMPAPYVADKLETSLSNLWNDFLRFIGISNISHQKKERQIRDEIQALKGGTIASRYSRFIPRKNAVDLLNKKFGSKLENEIEVSYYDELPTTDEEREDIYID